MTDNLKHDSSALLETHKLLWLRRRRGVLKEVACQLRPPVSRQFVAQVYWGHKASARVARALRRLRAPGFEVAA